jgi:hypothetical protein
MGGGYSDVNWFVRAARVAPVIAGAALLGGMIGGFAMFAIDSALTWEPSSWEPSTREPASQPRPIFRAEGEASAGVAQTTKPVRIVGGAIPDPSAGMSAPPPAPQQRGAATSAQSPTQISSQLLTPKPLGPASQLQSQTAPVAPTSAPPQQNQTAANQASVPTQTTTAAQQQTRWPDALSRAHQNGANAAKPNSAQQQTAPPPGGEGAASNYGDADRKQASGDRGATSAAAVDQDRGNTRRGRHSRRHWRGDDDDASAASSSPRQDARAYDRLYDSYGNRRDRSYGNMRERSYGGANGDQDDAASRSGLSRSEMRRFGRDARYQRRSQPDDSDRNQAIEERGQRSEPFWGGGFFRRGGDYRDDD